MNSKASEDLRRLLGIAKVQCGYRSVIDMAEAIGVHRNMPSRWIANGYVPEASIEAVSVALELDDESIAELHRLERLARRRAKFASKQEA